MKNKIVGILVCMLLIATAVPAVTSVKNSVINAIVPSISEASMIGDWIEEQKLLASDGAAQDIFGWSVSIDGSTALIGTQQDSDNGHWSGSAYVFTRTDTTWTQQTKLLPSDGAAEDLFGYSVSLDGNTALIGALRNDDNEVDSGSVYVFTRTGTTWSQEAKLLATDGGEGNHFGYYVRLVGDTAIIGANWDDDNGNKSGSAYVFTRTGTNWTQQQKLLASDGQEGDRFGGSIAFLNDTAFIGAYWDDDNGIDSGSMYVFTRTGTTWTQQTKLLPTDGAAGDSFGGDVSISGDTVLIGSGGNDDNGNDSGSAYVFTRVGTTWTQHQKLLASDGQEGDNFGSWGLSLDGDTALIGSNGDDDMGINSGSAYVFTRIGTTWIQQQKITASDGAAGDAFGFAVALSGDSALIGAYNDDDSGANSGSAYVFTKSGADLAFSIKGGLGVKAEITNNGTSDATDVPWQIHVEGGMLGMINKTVNGTIDIPAGETVTVKTGMLLGFGAISITAKVADEEQTATGKQIIIFSMVPK
jgi:hypothetical protein